VSRRALLEEIFRAALESVDGERAVARALPEPRREARPVFLAGAGKAVCAMARGAAGFLGDRLRGGLLVTKDGHGLAVPGCEVLEASHPLPDARGVATAERTFDAVRSLDPEAELWVLISGGASALWTAPVPGVALSEKREVTDRLLRAGAGIEDLNAVRKHLSRIKGGGLARAAGERAILTLLLSDVEGDRLDVIGSGPTAPDPSTFADALEVLERFPIEVPGSVRRHLTDGAAGRCAETPDAGDPLFARVEYRVVATLEDALHAAARAAETRGLRASGLGRVLVGEARDCAKRIAKLARSRTARGAHVIVGGGEATVTVRGSGRGGRAQEAALAFALEIEGESGIVALFAGTDGTDGPTDAAGAVVDGSTVARARAAGLDPRTHLDRNDSHPLLEATGDLLVTGPGRTNVTDLVLVAVG
jgi:hydroxypyruvate reductase